MLQCFITRQNQLLCCVCKVHPALAGLSYSKKIYSLGHLKTVAAVFVCLHVHYIHCVITVFSMFGELLLQFDSIIGSYLDEEKCFTPLCC